MPIMLALCLMLLHTYYAKNYAGIIDSGLFVSAKKGYFVTIIIHRDHIQVGMCKTMAYTVVGHMPI